MRALVPLLLLTATACQVPTEVRPFAQGMQRSSVDLSFLSSSTSDDFGGELAYFSDEYSENLGGSAESDGFLLGGYGRYYFVADAAQRPFAEVALGVGSADYGGGVDGFEFDQDTFSFFMGYSVFL